MAKTAPNDGLPRVGQAVHFVSTDRAHCYAATITQAMHPEDIGAEFEADRIDLEDYQPVTLAWFAPGSAMQTQSNIPHSPDKLFPITWHTIGECPAGR